MWIIFKTELEEIYEQLTEGTKPCQDQVHKHLCRSKFKKVESSLRIDQKMRFLKQSTMAKHIMSVANEEFDAGYGINEGKGKAAILVWLVCS